MAAAEQASPFLLCEGDVAFDLLAMLGRDQRADLGPLADRIAKAKAAGPFDEATDEIVVDAGLDKDARPGNAALSLARENAEQHAVDGLVEIGIGKDDVGRLAAQFEETGMIFSAATAPIRRPVAVPPVKVTLAIPGWATRAAPVMAPVPGNTDSRPFGRPASSHSFASSSASSGVNSDGLTITAFPAARAGATFCASLAIGEFHGVMAAITPSGSWVLSDR